MERGISINEACAKHVIGTQEDFERSCNSDGTVKEPKDTTTISLKNSDSSVTVSNNYLQIGGAVAAIAVVILVVFIARKLKHKKGK